MTPEQRRMEAAREYQATQRRLARGLVRNRAALELRHDEFIHPGFQVPSLPRVKFLERK